MYREYPKVYNYETLEYDRKSRADDQNMSVEEILETHGKILEEYAIRNLGGPIPEENKYREIGSGEQIKSRPEITRLLKDVESPAIKAVMVVDAQRLSRGDLEDAGRIIRILRYTNTLVITPTKTYDLRDEYDRDAFERELKKGNEYLEYFKKIQRRGKLASVKAGNYVGSVAPFGYDRVEKIDEKGKKYHTLEENKEEANIVRMIFDWYVNDGVGPTAICRRLEEMGVKTNSGLKKWNVYVIVAILQNVHYIGYVRWNWRKTVKIIEDQEVIEQRPKNVDEYMIFEGKHDPIVDKEIFDKAQEIKGQRHRTPTDRTLRNPLSGIMYCQCGYKMGYNSYRKRGIEYSQAKVVCNNQVRCKTGSASYIEVLEYIVKSLKETIEDFEVRVSKKDDDSVKLHRNLIDGLEKKLKELENKELLQWEAQYDPDESKRLPAEIFKRLNQKLLAEKEEVKKALATAKGSAPQPVDYAEKIVKLTDAMNALEDPDLPAKDKNMYLRNIIERIDYDRPEIKRLIKRGVNGVRWDAKPFKLKITLK